MYLTEISQLQDSIDETNSTQHREIANINDGLYQMNSSRFNSHNNPTNLSFEDKAETHH